MPRIFPHSIQLRYFSGGAEERSRCHYSGGEMDMARSRFDNTTKLNEDLVKNVELHRSLKLKNDSSL